MKENGQSDQKEKKAQDVSFFIKKMTIQWSMKVFFSQTLFLSMFSQSPLVLDKCWNKQNK